MTWLFLLLLLGPMNVLRGREVLNPAVFTALGAVLIAVIAFLVGVTWWKCLALLPVAACGLLLWRQPPMDFSCIHGRTPAYHKIPWLTDLCDFILTRGDGSIAHNRKWGTLWMTVRGLYGWPLFTSLFFIFPFAPLVGFIMALQGPVYAGMRLHKSEPVWFAEWIIATILAAGVAMILYEGASA